MPIAAGDNEVLRNLTLELRRGTVVLAVLSQLETALHGYGLRKALADQGLIVEENTLYPLLRRLESQGLLVSQWREEEKRNKRFYRLSTAGRSTLARLLEEWDAIDTALRRMVGLRGKRRAL
jgi:PadR family transcriptional regulator PadR